MPAAVSTLERASVTSSGRRYRPELQGIRAVAAFLVMFFHLWVGRVSGGVDVFFVIAGFLTAGTLFGHHARYGRIRFGHYLSRLLKRLAPASAVVLVATMAVWFLYMPRSRLADTAQEVIASALYFQNWQLVRDATDYLGAHDAASPVQHFWAMSLQGQFYVGFAVLAALGIAIAKLTRTPYQRVALIGFVAVFVVSFAWSIYQTVTNQAVAYFSTFTRAWEFALGGIVAVLVQRGEIPRWLKLPLGWIGLGLILTCGLVLDVSTQFPGAAALWPTTAAMLVLIAGGSGSRWGADALLGSRPMVYLGDISYGIYLWHWPILVTVLVHQGRTEVGLRTGVGIIVLTLILSAVTARLVENPIRRAKVGERRPWRGVAFGTAFLVVAAAGGAASATWIDREVDSVVAGYVESSDTAVVSVGGVDFEYLADYPGAISTMAGFVAQSAAEVKTYPPTVDPTRYQSEIQFNRCHVGLTSSELPGCRYGDASSDRVVVLVGGSHSAHLLPALDEAGRKAGVAVEVATKSSCIFSADPATKGGKPYQACEEFKDNTMQRLADDPPEAVITTSTRGKGEKERVPDGYVAIWEEVGALGIPVIAIRDNPQPGFNVPQCLDRHRGDASDCEFDRSKALADTDPTDALAASLPFVTFVDLSDAYCPDERCPTVLGNVMMFFDDNHLTEPFAKTLAPVLASRLGWLSGGQAGVEAAAAVE